MRLRLRFGRLLALAMLIPLLSACGAVVVGTAVTGAAIVHDRRSPGTVVDDQGILFKAIELRDQDQALTDSANVSIDVFNGQVLLTGEAENFELVEAFRSRILGIEKVRAVFNEVIVGAEATWSDATADAYLTSKVKLSLFDIDIDGFDPTRVNVTSSGGSVYLMGLLTVAEAEAVTEKVRYISGVKRVVRLFEYLQQ